jgi:ABC-type polysaccharide/polyol phosphate export permease
MTIELDFILRQWLHCPGMRSTPGAPLVVYDSARRRSIFYEELVEVWRYRDLILQMITRDIKTRYKRSAIGIAWTMLNPLLMMIVLTLVFSHLFRFDIHHYPVYLLSATVLWAFISQSTTAAMSHLLWGGALITRIYIPKTAFAVAAIGTGLVNLLLSLAPLLAISIATDLPLTLALLWLPVPIILSACFALGVALIVSAIVVGFPDGVDMYQVLLSAWYFLTPILYPVTIIPEASRWFLGLNPAFYLVEIFRGPIYSQSLGKPEIVVIAAVISIATMITGWSVFTARADKIAYSL